jgi:hypothetical protein
MPEVMEAPLAESEAVEAEPIESGDAAEIDGSESIQEGDSERELKEPTAAKGDLGGLLKDKQKVEALKAIDPSLPGKLRDFIFGQKRLEQAGGLKALLTAKTELEGLGGAEGVAETKAALADYGQLEQLFESGDAKFWSRLAEEAPESFANGMPSAIELFAKSDPELYGHVMARVLVATLDGARVSDSLRAVYGALSDDAAKAELKKVWDAIEGYRELGSKAPERKAKPEDDRVKRLETENQQIKERALLNPVADKGRAHLSSIAEREMSAAYQWSATDPDVKEAVMERVRMEVVRASKSDANFGKIFDNLKERGDAAGLERHIKQFQDRVTPKIIQRVAKLFAVKPKGASSAKKAAGTAEIKPAERGWERVVDPPKHTEVDRGKTTEDMVYSGKAVLKSGRKVQWA